MTVSRTSSVPSWDTLLFVVSACNTRSGDCYVKADLKLGFINQGIQTRAKTKRVIEVFLNGLREHLKSKMYFSHNKQVEQLLEALPAILTFINADSALNKGKKKALCSRATEEIHAHIEKCRPVHMLQGLIESAKKSDAVFNNDGIAFFELALDTMSMERLLVKDCIWMHMALYMKRIFRQLFSEAGGVIALPLVEGKCIFDWERFPNLTAEEFSLCKALEKGGLHNSVSMRRTINRILRESPHFDQFPVLKILKLFMLSLNCTTLITYLNSASFNQDLGCWNESDTRPYMFVEIRRIIALTYFAANEETMHVIDQQLQEMQKLVTAFRSNGDKMEALYREVLESYCTQATRAKYKSLLQKRILPLETFRRLGTHNVKLTKFKAMLLRDMPIHMANTLHKDSTQLLFNFFAQYLGFQTVSGNETKDTISEVEDSFNRLSLNEKPDMGETQAEVEILPTILYQQIVEAPPSIKAAPRVKDWQKKNPKILLCEPYDQLSSDAKEEAKLLHTFPIMISHFLRAFYTPVIWYSKDETKENLLYRAPGTIECYGSNRVRYEVEFQDCYDCNSSVLYHHFAKIRSFRQLLTESCDESFSLTQEEQNEISTVFDESELQSDLSVQITTDPRFIVQKSSVSIVVDDTVKCIRYTICFPHRIT